MLKSKAHPRQDANSGSYLFILGFSVFDLGLRSGVKVQLLIGLSNSRLDQTLISNSYPDHTLAPLAST